jgi:hypothetical protein
VPVCGLEGASVSKRHDGLGPIARLEGLEATLKSDIARGRLALSGLLGDQRLRIYRNGRIEGSAILAPEMLRAPRMTSRPADRDVAGGRYARVCAPVRVVLPVEGRVGAAAIAS